MKRKIYLSNKDKKIAGVCGGIAEYLEIDSTIVRLGWVILSIFGGAGVFIYIIAAIIMPEANPTEINPTEYIDIEEVKTSEEAKDKNKLLIGLMLIFLGVIFLAKNFFPQFPWYWLQFRYLFKNFWPIVLIILGIFTIINGRK